MNRPLLRRATLLIALSVFLLVGVTCGGAVAAEEKAGEASPAKTPSDKPPAEDGPAGADQDKSAGKIKIDEKLHAVTIPAVVAEQGKYDKHLKGAIEYLLVSKGGKDYEAVFVTDVAAAEINKALLATGLKSGRPATEKKMAEGKPVNIFVEYKTEGKTVKSHAGKFVARIKDGSPLDDRPWTYTGSRKTTDPESDREVLEATVTRNLIGLHPGDGSPLFQNPRQESRKENTYKANTKALPPAGTAVSITFQRVMPKVAAGTRRVHLFISGRVQGVGFRAFTQRQARGLGLTGWVRNLRDGRVEAIVVGPKKKVAQLLEKVNRGPRAARVEKVDITDESPEGEFKDFTRKPTY